jgi:hypothetical protein
LLTFNFDSTSLTNIKVKDNPIQNRRGAVMIIGMLARAKPTIISDKLDVLVSIGLEKSKVCDYKIPR